MGSIADVKTPNAEEFKILSAQFTTNDIEYFIRIIEKLLNLASSSAKHT